MKALPYRITTDCQDTGLKSLFGRHSVKDPQVFGLGNPKNTRHHDEVLDDSTRQAIKEILLLGKNKVLLHPSGYISRKLLYETGLDRWVIVFCVARCSLHEKRCSSVNTTVQCFDIVQRTQMDFGKEQRSGIRP